MIATSFPAGDRGVLVRFDAIEAPALLAHRDAALERHGVDAAIPGAASLLLLFHHDAIPELRTEAVDAAMRPIATPRGGLQTPLEVPVSFAPEDAPDLPLLLERTGMDRARFFQTLSRLRLRARFLGFRPGFAYLEGLPERWNLPRRPTPRSHVPAGSFAIAGEMAGFYPEDSPGGWNLIGRSDAVFWDPARERPNLIAAGAEVRIVPVRGPVSRPDQRPTFSEPRHPIAEVLGSGTACVATGSGRGGRTAWGLPAGGWFDEEAARVANHNLGNRDDAWGVECALSGPSLLLLDDTTGSWAGASAEISISGDEVRDLRIFHLPRGSELKIGGMREGARGVLAIRGGIEPGDLRSLAARIQARQILGAAGGETGPARIRDLVRRAPSTIEALLGPDPVPPGWREMIASQEWEVSPRSDRSAVRFRGGRSPSNLPASLDSTGMQFGTVQWHPDGSLVAMGPDHPVTGGYLQPMTIPSSERWKLAQLRPGDTIRWELR